jgi:hypothetical protein
MGTSVDMLHLVFIRNAATLELKASKISDSNKDLENAFLNASLGPPKYK